MDKGIYCLKGGDREAKHNLLKKCLKTLFRKGGGGLKIDVTKPL
jgi:hypothetical protein